MKVEQISVQGDHIHALVRTYRRSQFHYFFRVVAGQIAQQFEQDGKLLPLPVTHTPNEKQRAKMTDTPQNRKTKANRSQQTGNPSCRGTKLWRHRPFSRVVKGWKAYQTVRNYIQLNEKEALGQIIYRKERLRGLSMQDWEILWS